MTIIKFFFVHSNCWHILLEPFHRLSIQCLFIIFKFKTSTKDPYYGIVIIIWKTKISTTISKWKIGCKTIKTRYLFMCCKEKTTRMKRWWWIHELISTNVQWWIQTWKQNKTPKKKNIHSSELQTKIKTLTKRIK